MTKTRAAFLFFVMSVAVPAEAQTGKLPPEAPVTVLIRDTVASPEPDRIRSDGKGPYEDGIDNVNAVFMPRGDLHLVTNISRRAAIRTLFLDFTSLAISLTPNLKPFPNGFTQADLMNIILKPDGTIDIGLRDIPLNESRRTAVNITFDDPDPSKDLRWRIHRGYSDINTHLALASHSLDAQGEYWALEASYPNDVAALQSAPRQGKGNVVWTTEGYYHLPFRLVVRKK